MDFIDGDLQNLLVNKFLEQSYFGQAVIIIIALSIFLIAMLILKHPEKVVNILWSGLKILSFKTFSLSKLAFQKLKNNLPISAKKHKEALNKKDEEILGLDGLKRELERINAELEPQTKALSEATSTLKAQLNHVQSELEWLKVERSNVSYFGGGIDNVFAKPRSRYYHSDIASPLNYVDFTKK